MNCTSQVNVSSSDLGDSDATILANMVVDLMFKNTDKYQSRAREDNAVHNLGRYEGLAEDKDDARVWKALNCKGEYCSSQKRSEQVPSDDDFRKHFEAVLHQTNVVGLFGINTSVPVLDEPIWPDQVREQIKKLQVDKGCVPDGPAPGMLTLLTAEWILTLTSLFNNVFQSVEYPESRRRAKLLSIFKRGYRSDVNNYRGIGVINSVAKHV